MELVTSRFCKNGSASLVRRRFSFAYAMFFCALASFWPGDIVAAIPSSDSRIEAEVLTEIARAGFADVSVAIKRTEALLPFAPFEQPLRGRDLTEARRLQRIITQATGFEPYFTGFGLLTSVRANLVDIIARDAATERVRLSRSNFRMSTLTNAIVLGGSSPSLFSSLGTGEEVMIIEGSFDPQHPALSASRIVEHCFGVVGTNSLVQCLNGTGDSTERHGQGAAVMATPVRQNNSQPLVTTALFHGMSVASIVAAANGPFDLGFAPQAILHLANVSGNTSNGWIASGVRWDARLPDESILKALSWAITYSSSKASNRLRAVNLSLGRYPSGTETACASFTNYQAYKTRFEQLRSQGVLVTVAAGNEPAFARHFPACIDSAFAVTMAKNIALGSGAQLELDPDTTLSVVAGEEPKLAAPSGPVLTATTQFTSASGARAYVTALFGGTSGAAPMVAGCAALIAGRLAAEGRPWDLPKLISALKLGPTNLTRAGATYAVPFLGCHQAYQRIVAGTASIDPNNHRLTGTFFDYSAPGQGFVFEINPVQGTLTGGWFSNKQPVVFPQGQGQHWLSLNRIGLDGNTVVMDILAQRFMNRRPIFNATNGAGAGVHESFRVGTARLTFRTCDLAELKYEFDSATPPTSNAFPQSLAGSIALQRLGVSFGCTNNQEPPNSAWMPSTISGIWGRAKEVNGTWQFDPDYSGQGLMLDSGPSGASPYLFGGWYSYAGAIDTTGDPVSSVGSIEYRQRYRWLTFVASPSSSPGTGILNPTTEPHEYTADLAITAGGTFVLPSPTPIAYVVGKTKIKFHSCRRATFTYTFSDMWFPFSTGSAGGRGFDGITGFLFPGGPPTTGTFEIVRVLADPVAGCTLP